MKGPTAGIDRSIVFAVTILLGVLSEFTACASILNRRHTYEELEVK